MVAVTPREPTTGNAASAAFSVAIVAAPLNADIATNHDAGCAARLNGLRTLGDGASAGASCRASQEIRARMTVERERVERHTNNHRQKDQRCSAPVAQHHPSVNWCRVKSQRYTCTTVNELRPGSLNYGLKDSEREASLPPSH
jgi:hypothetical protein